MSRVLLGFVLVLASCGGRTEDLFSVTSGGGRAAGGSGGARPNDRPPGGAAGALDPGGASGVEPIDPGPPPVMGDPSQGGAPSQDLPPAPTAGSAFDAGMPPAAGGTPPVISPPPSTAGAPNTSGGAPATGGGSGAGGSQSVVESCIAIADSACDKCLCKTCAPEVTTCFEDTGCSLIFACVSKYDCEGLGCYSNFTCKKVIDQYGGLKGAAVKAVTSLTGCAADSQKSCKCK